MRSAESGECALESREKATVPLSLAFITFFFREGVDAILESFGALVVGLLVEEKAKLVTWK